MLSAANEVEMAANGIRRGKKVFTLDMRIGVAIARNYVLK